MEVHELTQGSQEWLAFRATHFGASEAAAMLGLSKTMTRPELLHMKATGLTPEFTAWVQKNVLDHGHVVEGLTLPLIEKHIGEDLYPATCSEGRISASCDGLTMAGDIAWENKQPNAEIVAQVKAGQMPEQHMPQCQQVLMVTGASKLIFSVSDGTGVLHMLEVFPDPAWFERLRAGWAQFEVDLANYEPPAATTPAPTGRAPETLPALFITVKGEVTESNLASFKEVALAAIRSVNRDLQNDQDFADAEKAVKWCEDVEKRVAGAKQHAQSQAATIDTLFKTMDDISAEARQVRLDLEKLVKARKVSLKTEMLTEAQTALGDHIRGLNKRLGRDHMPQVAADFAGAISGKRNFDSMRDALNATLANAKIAANATADKIQLNLAYLQEDVPQGHAFLFADLSTIVLKANDDFRILVDSRIAAHKAKKAQEEADTRERIRKEEKDRMDNQQIAGIQQQVLIATQGRAGVRQGGTIECIRETLAETESWLINADQFAEYTVARAQAAKDDALRRIRQLLSAAELKATHDAVGTAALDGIAAARSEGSMPPALLNEMQGVATDLIADLAVGRASESSKPANVVPMRASAAPAPVAAPATPPTMKLGDINALLSPIALTAEGLATLGFPATTVKSAKLYHHHDLTNICGALHDLLDQVQAKQAA